MKTLDEALDTISSRGKGGSARVTDEAAKFMPIASEIVKNDRVVSLCVATVGVVSRSDADPTDWVFNIWFEAFTAGVKVGMEMERNDSGVDVKKDLG